jgi:type IV pilus assembly protein PilM
VVEIGRSEGRPTLLRFGTAHVSPDAVVEGEIMDRELLLSAIESAFESAEIKKDKVVTAVSSRSVIVKRLLMDRMTAEEARALIEMEASSHIPFDIEDVSLDFQVLEPNAGDGKMEVLLVAAKREVIYEHLSLLRDAGLTPTVIDVDTFAIQNLHEGVGGEEPLATLVNVGSEVTNVSIVRDGFPLFTRDFSVGCGQYLEALQRDLEIPYEDALRLISTNNLDRTHPEEAGQETIARLSEEIAVGLERSLAYLRSAGEVEELSAVYLSGGGGNLPVLRERLEERLRLPVKTVDPLSALEIDPDVETEMRELGLPALLGVAVGLGLREVLA